MWLWIIGVEKNQTQNYRYFSKYNQQYDALEIIVVVFLKKTLYLG
jgi:hypothetical protein